MAAKRFFVFFKFGVVPADFIKNLFQKSRVNVNKPPLFLLTNQKGVAVVEMLPLLVVFVMLFGLAFGFWTTIHSGTLSSIGARHYAFEVINNRTHFVYHRSDGGSPRDKDYFKKNGYRFFAVVKYQLGLNPDLKLLKRSINLFDSNPQWSSSEFINQPNQANPIGIKAAYGICIDFDCGGK